MNVGVNGPVLRGEVIQMISLSLVELKLRNVILVFLQGMYNNYAAVKTSWSDTTLMDNIRGADATDSTIPGSQVNFGIVFLS